MAARIVSALMRTDKMQVVKNQLVNKVVVTAIIAALYVVLTAISGAFGL